MNFYGLGRRGHQDTIREIAMSLGDPLVIVFILLGILAIDVPIYLWWRKRKKAKDSRVRRQPPR
jgi:hypothetical protein